MKITNKVMALLLALTISLTSTSFIAKANDSYQDDLSCIYSKIQNLVD